MSITSGFEKKDGKCCECGSFDGRDVLALLSHARSLEAQNEELKAMLKGLEFDDDGICKVCNSPESLYEHSPDCALAKLIG